MESEYHSGLGLLIALGLIALILAGSMTYLLVFPVKAKPGSGTPISIPFGISGDTTLNFSPPNLNVTLNQQVTWKNSDGAPHTATAISAPSSGTKWDSGELDPGDTFTVTFTVPGVYTYHCLFHPAWMKGTITVSK